MPVPAGAEALVRDAVRAERQRNGRRGALIRLVGVSAFVAIDLIAGVLFGLPLWQGHLAPFACYWALALVTVLIVRRSPASGELLGISVALVDIPMVFVLVRGFVTNIPERPDGPATFALALYVFLTIVAGLSIDRRQ